MSFISTLAQSQNQVSRLKDLQVQLSTLQNQIATGKKTQSLSGLGSDAVTSVRSRANFNILDSYIQNIDLATTRITQMSQGLSLIQSQTKIAIDSLNGQIQAGEIDTTTIKRLATAAYEAVTSTLNMKDGNSYVFAGSDAAVQPFTDSGSLDTYYTSLNAQWQAGTLTVNPPNTDIAEEYISRMRNIPQVTQGYSASLNNAKSVNVKADSLIEINISVYANDPSLQNIVSALSALKNIGDLNNAPGATDQEKKDNFYKVFNDITKNLTSSVTKLQNRSADLANAQAQLNNIKDAHNTEKTTLQNTIDRIENIDLNEAAVSVQSLGTQLQASYQVTALIGQLSLSNFF